MYAIMTNKNFKIVMFSLVAIATIVALPSTIIAQDGNDTKITRYVTEEEFREVQNKVLDLRSEQQKLIRDTEGSIEKTQQISQIDAEVNDLMPILDKHQEQNFEKYYIEPQRKAELESAEEGLRAQLAELELTDYAVNLNYKTKVIEVVIEDSSKNTQVNTFIASYGENIPFEFSNGEITLYDEACANQTDDCDPVVGGVEIEGDCSLALPVRDGSWPFYNYYYATAGHCLDDNEVMNQPNAGSGEIGDNTDSEYVGDCDCALSDKTGGNAPGSDVWRSSNNYLVVTTESSSRPSMGTDVTLSGKASGFIFGEVQDGSFTFTAEGINWDLIETDLSTSGGDSGGTLGDADMSDILGIHKGKVTIGSTIHTIHSAWEEFDSDYSVSLY